MGSTPPAISTSSGPQWPAREGWIDPFEQHTATPGRPCRTFAHRLDATDERCDHRLGSLRHPEHLGHGADVTQDVGKARGLQADDTRWAGQRCRESGDAPIIDRTHIAEPLREDGVRAQAVHQVLVHRVERAGSAQPLANPAVHLRARQPRAVDLTVRDTGLAAHLLGVVALVADPEERVQHAERRDDLGRRGQERDHAHGSIAHGPALPRRRLRTSRSFV